MSDQKYRLFIALNLPGELAKRLADEQRALGGSQAPVKWVDPTDAHLTLQFLGSVALELTEALFAAIAAAGSAMRPFVLRLHGLGGFPNLRRPRVIWAGLSGDTAALERLQRQVIAETQQLGFVPEKRSFKPHITLGRVREGADPAACEQLGRAVAARSFSPTQEWQVGSLALMRSELHPSGARYSLLGEAPLR